VGELGGVAVQQRPVAGGVVALPRLLVLRVVPAGRQLRLQRLEDETGEQSALRTGRTDGLPLVPGTP
jgi:hypothetical protein